jgi:hypothetical protein
VSVSDQEAADGSANPLVFYRTPSPPGHQNAWSKGTGGHSADSRATQAVPSGFFLHSVPFPSWALSSDDPETLSMLGEKVSGDPRAWDGDSRRLSFAGIRG